MPKFWVSDEEADAIVTAVLSLTKEQIPLAAQKQLGADERYVEKGRRLVRNFNCQGCHQIGEKGGNIKAVVASHLEAAGVDSLSVPSVAMGLSPPLLYNAAAKIGEGSRVQTPWLHDFLKDPSRKIRPWLDLRMPTFEFTEDELNTLTRFFAAHGRRDLPVRPEAHAGSRRWWPRGTTSSTSGSASSATWWRASCRTRTRRTWPPTSANVPTRLRADWLSKWLADPGHIQPGTKMPANFPANPEENAFPEILGGDQKLQIEAVRSYLLTLGPGGLQTRPGASPFRTRARPRSAPGRSSRPAPRLSPEPGAPGTRYSTVKSWSSTGTEPRKTWAEPASIPPGASSAGAPTTAVSAAIDTARPNESPAEASGADSFRCSVQAPPERTNT